MDQTPPNFQGVISTYGRTSSNIWFFKKLKYEKLLLVKLLRNTGCSPFQQAELDSGGLIVEGDQDTWDTVFAQKLFLKTQI